MNIFFLSAFGEENLEGEMIIMKSACFVHLYLKFIDFFWNLEVPSTGVMFKK